MVSSTWTTSVAQHPPTVCELQYIYLTQYRSAPRLVEPACCRASHVDARGGLWGDLGTENGLTSPHWRGYVHWRWPPDSGLHASLITTGTVRGTLDSMYPRHHINKKTTNRYLLPDLQAGDLRNLTAMLTGEGEVWKLLTLCHQAS